MKELKIDADLPIGSVGTIQNGTIEVKVVEHKRKESACKRCAIRRTLCADALCLDIQREDNKDVYFKSVKK